MKNIRGTAYLLAVLMGTSCLVHAQATRTWVSGVGDDANPCSRTAPCKTFAGAISKTAAGGEIDALDPGGFGALTITKSITIDGGGGQVASVLVAATNGFVVAAAATDVVTIRNVSIQGLACPTCSNPGINGIRFISGKELHIENVTVQNFSTDCVDYTTTTASSSLFISGSILRACGFAGVNVSGITGGTNRVTITNSLITRSSIGVLVNDNNRVAIQDTAIANNLFTGVFSLAKAGGTASISLDRCTVSNNGGTGVIAGDPTATGPSNVWISNNQIDFNVGNGVTVSTNGHVMTFLNNGIQGNGTDGCPGCTTVSGN